MKIPAGKTEQDVLTSIDKAVTILAPSFVFGFYDLDDIKQEATLAVIELLNKDKYDASRPLDNYVYTCVRNFLINFKRNKLRRNDPPCADCHDGEFCTGSGEPCGKYRAWDARNSTKANLMRPLELNFMTDEHRPSCSSVSEDVETEELIQMVDQHLPVELRSTYLQMRSGVTVPRNKRLAVEKAVKDILRGDVECPQNEDD